MNIPDDGWVTVQDWTSAPPIEHPYRAAGTDCYPIGLASRGLVAPLDRPRLGHPMEGKVFYHVGPDGPTLTVTVPTWPVGLLAFSRVRLTLLEEPGLLQLPQPVLDALRSYAMDWPDSACPIHWHERAGVPVITRIRQVARLLRNWREAWDRYPDERGEDDWTAPAMAHAGLVEPDPDPAVVAARVAAKWPALWGKYGCDAALNHCPAGMTDRPI